MALQTDIPAAEVVYLVKPGSLEHSEGNVAFLTVIADQKNGVLLGYPVKVFAQHVLAEVVRTTQVRLCVADGITKIDGDRSLLKYKLLKFLGKDGGAETGLLVDGCEGCHVHRTIGRVERRGVGEVEFCKVFDGQSACYCCSQYVDSLVHTHSSGDLGSKDLLRCLIPNQHQAHFLRSRIVGGMARLVYNHSIGIEAGILGSLQAQTGGTCCNLKDFYNGGTHRPIVHMIAS